MGGIRCQRLGLQILPPYFKRAESWIRGGDAYRGDEGPLGVSAGNDMRLSPLYRAFIDAGVQAGYPETQDYNGEFQEGFGPMHMTVSGGERESTARAYLKPVLNRPNLTLVTHARAHRVVLDRKGNGRVGERKKQTTTYTATKEVILSAGSIASPVLLQLSV